MATNQFLTFTLAEELYAVEVAQVQKVLSEMPLKVIPRMPAYMNGAINCAGDVRNLNRRLAENKNEQIAEKEKSAAARELSLTR